MANIKGKRSSVRSQISNPIFQLGDLRVRFASIIVLMRTSNDHSTFPNTAKKFTKRGISVSKVVDVSTHHATVRVGASLGDLITRSDVRLVVFACSYATATACVLWLICQISMNEFGNLFIEDNFSMNGSTIDGYVLRVITTCTSSRRIAQLSTGRVCIHVWYSHC